MALGISMSRVTTFIVLIIFSVSCFAEEKMSLLSDGQEAEAVCIVDHESGNSCFIIIRETEVDVTSVESANLGKLSLRSRDAYSKIISFPSKWLKASEEEYVVKITTQAWFEGQRYSVAERVYVTGGVYQQR
jgi:hypothetical protein